MELSEQYSPSDPNGLKILCNALMKRVMTDVERIWKIRQEKPTLQQLVSKGVINHDIFQNLLKAELETEDELRDVKCICLLNLGIG